MKGKPEYQKKIENNPLIKLDSRPPMARRKSQVAYHKMTKLGRNPNMMGGEQKENTGNQRAEVGQENINSQQENSDMLKIKQVAPQLRPNSRNSMGKDHIFIRPVSSLSL